MLLFYVLVSGPRGMLDLGLLTRELEVIPPTLEGKVLTWTSRGVPNTVPFMQELCTVLPKTVSSPELVSSSWGFRRTLTCSMSGYLWSSNPRKSSDIVPRAWSPVSRSKTAIEACNQYPLVCPTRIELNPHSLPELTLALQDQGQTWGPLLQIPTVQGWRTALSSRMSWKNWTSLLTLPCLLVTNDN